jgi:hypothetical protein
MKTRIVTMLLSIAVLAAVTTAANPAQAETGVKANCIVATVAFDQHIFLQCGFDSANYFGFTTAEQPSCGAPTNVTVDTLKIWESMLMSALLSRRPVDIYFNTGCAGGRGIFNIAVKAN